MRNNAIIGGVLLAGIEGLQIWLTRYAMPWWEQRQQQGMMPIDLLDPPTDPKRRRINWGQTPSSLLTTDDILLSPDGAPTLTLAYDEKSSTGSNNKEQSEKKNVWRLW